jgi:hypothetical protein
VTIARRRNPGLWLDIVAVSGADFEHFDANLAEAVDGRGGAYILVEDLEFGGADLILGDNLEVGNDLSVGGDLQVSGNAIMVGDLTVGVDDTDVFTTEATTSFLGPSTFAREVTFADLVIAEADWTFEQDVDVGGNLDVGGDIALTGSLTVGGGLYVAGSLDADGNCYLGGASGIVEVLGTTTIRKPVSFGNEGKLRWRQQLVATDANQTCLGAQVDSFILPNGVFTAARSVTIDDTGATDGMRINFRSRDTSFLLTVKDPGGNNLDTLAGATLPWGYAERIGGSWVWQRGGIP